MRPDKNPVFEKSHMTDEEFILMAKVIKQENPEMTAEEIMLEIDLINDLAEVQQLKQSTTHES